MILIVLTLVLHSRSYALLVSHSIEHPKNVAEVDFLICGIKAYNRSNSTNHISLTIHTSRKRFKIRWIACSSSFIMITPPLRASSISISSIITLKSQYLSMNMKLSLNARFWRIIWKSVRRFGNKSSPERPGRIDARENVVDAHLLDCLWPTFGHYSLGLDLRKSSCPWLGAGAGVDVLEPI